MLPLLVAAAVTFPVTSRTTVVIDAGAADVKVTGSARVDAEVQCERANASLDADRIVVRSEDADGPPDRGNRARVVLNVPHNVRIESIRIVDGELTLRDLDGSVSADVRQGKIRGTRLAGVLRLETGFGDVAVERARLSQGGLLRLRAFNGDVKLSLEGQPENARVLALTFNGRIESNLQLRRRESFGPRFAEATFGSGEPVISLDSVTGNITITAAASPRR